MPSTSAKQHRFMEAVAHNPAFAKKVGVSQSVGKDYSVADKGKTFKKGDAIMMNKKVPMKKGGMPPAAMAAMMARRLGAKPRPMAPADAMAPGMKKGGMPMKDGKPAFMMGKKMMGGGMAKYAKGGSVSARADGIATKGKTKGKMI